MGHWGLGLLQKVKQIELLLLASCLGQATWAALVVF